MNKNPLSGSSKVAMAALVGMAAAELTGVLLLEGEHPSVELIIKLVLLTLTALVFTRQWWATAMAAGLSSLLAILSFSSAISVLVDSRIQEFFFYRGFHGSGRGSCSRGFPGDGAELSKQELAG